MHRQLVYQALGTLERKGYATAVIKNRRKHFQAVSPDAILKHLEKDTERAMVIVPELLKLQAHALDAVEVRTLYGREGFISNLRDVIESAARGDGSVSIIGGAKDEDFYRTIGDWYPEYVALLKKRHVIKKLIAPESYAEEFKTKFAEEYGNRLRFLKVGLSAPTYTRMTQEMVTIEIYIEHRDVTVIQIRNRAIAQAYLEHFGLLWNQATEYHVHRAAA
jgi:sugar-specific transcriptional regulator TrmB